MDDSQLSTYEQLAARSPLNSDQHPAFIYVNTIRERGGNSNGVEGALTLATKVLTSGKTKDYLAINWSSMRFQHMMLLRTALQDYLYEKKGKEEMQELSRNTINHAMSIVRGVLKLSWQLGQMTVQDYSLAISVQGVKGSEIPAGRYVTSGEREACVNACARDEKDAGCRDAVIFMFACMLAMRREEIALLKYEWYNPSTSEIKVLGKGNKERMVPVSDNVLVAFNDWISIRGTSDGRLFNPINRGNNIQLRVGMSTTNVFNIIDRRRIEAGVIKFTPHDLRRSLISDLIDAGVDLVIISRLVGHNNVSTTAGYDRRPDARIRSALSNIHMPYTSRIPQGQGRGQ